MKIKRLLIGMLMIGSLAMVGCDDIEDTSGVIDEGSVTETEEKNLKDPDIVQAEEDYNRLNESDTAISIELIVNSAISNYNNGVIKDIEQYVEMFTQLVYCDGSFTVGEHKLSYEEAVDMALYTIGSSPSYTVNDLETKKKCAIAGLKNVIAWERNINTDNLEFQEQTEINGQILFFILQGHGTVGRAMYEPSTGHVGYEINIAQ